MNDNDETRSYTEIAAENTELRKQVDGYERAWAVAEAMVANNDVLRSVDVGLALYMYERGKATVHDSTDDYFSGKKTAAKFEESLEQWKEQQAK